MDVLWSAAHRDVVTYQESRTLPLEEVDLYHQYFLWTFLDLKSVGYGVEWRETNFPSNPRSWKNGTHAFGSTARVSLLS